jgi:hypothetical protein
LYSEILDCHRFVLPTKRTKDLNEFFDIVMKEPGLSVALDDLIQAISTPYILPVSCARAIEALRHLFAHANESRAATWARMREHLNLTEEYIRLITSRSVAPRHGDVSGVGGDVTSEISTRSWTVMNRYLHYRKGGCKRLLLADFPLL